MTHYHTGHGLAGYGPQGESAGLCLSLDCLLDCVHTELSDVLEMLHGEATSLRDEAYALRKLRPSNGSDPSDYRGSWESIATAAMLALEASGAADDVENLRLNLSPERRKAPLYRDFPGLWTEHLERSLLQGDMFPLDTQVTGEGRYYVWSCEEWRCLLSEHDTDYVLPASCAQGGVVPCACRDCMEVAYWSPTDGRAPYCSACADAECDGRISPECDAITEEGADS